MHILEPVHSVKPHMRPGLERRPSCLSLSGVRGDWGRNRLWLTSAGSPCGSRRGPRAAGCRPHPRRGAAPRRRAARVGDHMRISGLYQRLLATLFTYPGDRNRRTGRTTGGSQSISKCAWEIGRTVTVIFFMHMHMHMHMCTGKCQVSHKLLNVKYRDLGPSRSPPPHLPRPPRLPRPPHPATPTTPGAARSDLWPRNESQKTSLLSIVEKFEKFG